MTHFDSKNSCIPSHLPKTGIHILLFVCVCVFFMLFFGHFLRIFFFFIKSFLCYTNTTLFGDAYILFTTFICKSTHSCLHFLELKKNTHTKTNFTDRIRCCVFVVLIVDRSFFNSWKNYYRNIFCWINWKFRQIFR